VSINPDGGDKATTWIRPVGRFAPSTLCAAGWTALSIRRARRVLRSDGVSGRIPFPPRLSIGATRGVMAVLRRTDPTCLERATVLQTWLAAHDKPVDIVVGVAADRGKITAHAWIEPGTPATETARYREIHRIAPPTPRAG
jgi:hypothetical protein